MCVCCVEMHSVELEEYVAGEQRCLCIGVGSNSAETVTINWIRAKKTRGRQRERAATDNANDAEEANEPSNILKWNEEKWKNNNNMHGVRDALQLNACASAICILAECESRAESVRCERTTCTYKMHVRAIRIWCTFALVCLQRARIQNERSVAVCRASGKNPYHTLLRLHGPRLQLTEHFLRSVFFDDVWPRPLPPIPFPHPHSFRYCLRCGKLCIVLWCGIFSVAFSFLCPSFAVVLR